MVLLAIVNFLMAFGVLHFWAAILGLASVSSGYMKLWALPNLSVVVLLRSSNDVNDVAADAANGTLVVQSVNATSRK